MQVCDDNRLYNTITGFEPSPPSFPQEHNKDNDPYWEYKDEDNGFKKWVWARN